VKEYEEFLELLEAEDKQKAVNYALDLIESGKMDVVGLYSDVLTPAKNQMQCRLSDKKICIWKEHLRTAIVRTIVECCYPYVTKNFNITESSRMPSAVIICPPEENHDLGARMIADFFTICGWRAVFIGSNTPYEDFYNASELIRPEIIAISISNYYTIVEARKIIADLKSLLGDSVKIIVGGYAVRSSSGNFDTLGADYHADTFDDIKRIADEEAKKI